MKSINFLPLTLFTGLLLLPVSTSALPVKSSSDKLIVQAFIDDRCPDKYVYLLGSTKNHSVTICGSKSTGKPTHYLSDTKKNGGSVFLPLSSYTDTQFVARNDKYTYILDVKKKTLTVKVLGQRPGVEKFTVETP